MHKLLFLCVAVLLSATTARAGYNTPTTPAGTSGQLQYNNNGAMGGLPQSTFDASGAGTAAAAAVKSYFTSTNGLLSCNGTGCAAATSVPTNLLSGTIAAINGGNRAVVTPEEYAAGSPVGNTAFYFDGSFTSSGTVNITGSATNATPTTPAVTTITANDYVVSIFATGSAYTTAPSGGTTRASVAEASGIYGMLAVDQLVASPSTTTPISSTTTSNGWATAAIALAPSAGNSISFVASNTFNSMGATTATLTKPTGTASGDYLIVCEVNYQPTAQANYYSTPAGWVLIQAIPEAGTNLICYGKVATSSEPTSYSFLLSGSTGRTAVILDYRGTTGPDTPTSLLSSATAGFTSAAVGYPICVAGVTGSPVVAGQLCGTITSYVSPTSVNVSFGTYRTASNLQFAYGHDDTSIFTTMLTTAPCSLVGCKVSLQGHYGLTGPLTLPANIPISIEGVGPGVPNTANTFVLPGAVIVNANNGSMLDYLTTSMTKAGITLNGVSALPSTTAVDTLRNFAMYGGAGVGSDGAGADGIDIINWQNALVDTVTVFNFKGAGGLTGSLNMYSENIVWNHFYSGYNGGAGWQLGLALADFMESTDCEFCVIEANGGPGILVKSGNVLGMDVSNYVIQWDNRFGANREITLSGGIITSGKLGPGYFEVDTVDGSQSNGWLTPAPGILGLDTGHPFFSCIPASACLPITYSAAGNALPTCTTASNPSTVISNNLSAVVTDAKLCSPGTTYASGGTGTCQVTCTNNNWVVQNQSVVGSPPTVAVGAAAGTGATASVTGSSISGSVTVNAGTSTTSTATLATITFPTAYGTAPRSCTLQPQNAAAVTQVGMVYSTAPSTTAWTLAVGASAVPVSTTYVWGYSCL